MFSFFLRTKRASPTRMTSLTIARSTATAMPPAPARSRPDALQAVGAAAVAAAGVKGVV